MYIPEYMDAMILEKQNRPLVFRQIKVPELKTGMVLVKVIACGICRTDLHIADGDLKNPKLPLVLGHEIVGEVIKTHDDGSSLKPCDLVGIPWLGYTCGHCRYCLKGMENLCENALFTGYTIDGGFAQYTAAFENYCFPISDKYADPGGAPLLCAGLIGYRSYRMISKTGIEFENIGIYGFGAAAHILIQIAIHQKKKVFAFTRKGDLSSQKFAKDLGAVWAGSSEDDPPYKLDAAIIFAPAGSLVPKALRDLDKGGIVVCGGIHMSDIPTFPYEILWEERIVRSVANLTREDAVSFLSLINEIPVKTDTELFKIEQTNEAMDKLRNGKINGAAVLIMDH